MPFLHPFVTFLGFAFLCFAAVYSALNGVARLVWQSPRGRRQETHLPPISILKPLYGAEPRLYEDLRSFCRQDYPEYQIVFGVRDESDPAYRAATEVAAEFPALPITVVVSSQLHGNNWKVSNLINMLPHARHDILVMADSDVFVEPHYLRVVTPPLQDPRIGLVTCIYQAMPTPGVWSRIGAMYVNEWYVPSILLAWLFGHQGYVSGQTLCIRHATLEALGGLTRLANHLADDHQLGTLVRGLGLRIELSRYSVIGAHHEPSLDSVIRHELRWMRTLRVLRPGSFRWLFLTFSLPLAVLGVVLVAASAPSPTTLTAAKCLFAVTFALRLWVHVIHRLPARRRLLRDLWLLPIRDLLLCWVWLKCFFTSTVSWRGNDFSVDSDGVMRQVS